MHDDHLKRVFTADGPDLFRLADITEHATREGKRCLYAIKDVYSNRIVGYSIDIPDESVAGGVGSAERGRTAHTRSRADRSQ